uniref:PNPLA domain-containing protein n=1 Tax=viral metagenome TaxID=1070528 RepID=A0A6C0E490_9ZZZZ
MIQEYVNRLVNDVDNLQSTSDPIQIDLILEGGVFNGSYLVGALYFLREMENRKYIKINRISGCSIGSVLAFLYLINGLDSSADLYDKVYKKIKQTNTLECVKDLKTMLHDLIDKKEDICKIVNNRLFITYHNLSKQTKPVKSVFRDIDDIIDTIIRSCFVPLLIDGNLTYKKKYIDGIIPFVFEPNTDHGLNKILYLNICGYDRFTHIFNVKNESSNFHRMMTGVLDVHDFYIKQQNNNMCSYVDEFSIKHNITYAIKRTLEKIIVFFINILVYLQGIVPAYCYDTFICKFIYKTAKDFCKMYIETYCI